ncbi:MAG: hypothetical protein ACE5I9_05850 [Candidatus Methylomirabilales bacterium]
MVRGRIIFIAVGLLLVGVGLRLWLQRGPSAPPAKVSPPATEVTEAPQQAAQQAPRLTTPKREVTLMREELEALSRGPWGRNPFLTPEEEAVALGLVSTQEELAPGFAPLEVRAILVSEGRKVAMINSHVVTEGDLVGEERVLEIRPHAVVLGKGKHTRTVEMQFSSLPVRLTPAPTGPR